MSWLDGLRHRAHTWLHRRTYERDVAEERRFHREMEAMEGRGGDDSPALQSRPRPDSVCANTGQGGSSDPRGPRPGSSLIDWLAQDATYALRGLARSPGFTILVVLTLAMGVGANSAAFSVLDRLFNRVPSGLTDPDGLRRLYREIPSYVLRSGESGALPIYTYAAYSAVAEAGEGVYQAAAWTSSRESMLQDGTASRSVQRSFVSSNYFSVLGVEAERGRLFSQDEVQVDVPSHIAVITHALWEHAFGLDPSVVGRSIRLDAGEFTVVGVAADPFVGLELGHVDVFLPLGPSSAPRQGSLPWYQGTAAQLFAAARLNPGVTDLQVSERATAGYLRRNLPGAQQTIDSTETVSTGPIIEARGPGRRAASRLNSPGLSVSTRAAAISTILLLVTCMNVAVLLLVRASKRRRETALRLAVGCSRGRLSIQFLVEALLLTLLAGSLALAVATWGGRLLRDLLFPDVAWLQAFAEPRTVAFSLASATLVTVSASLVPLLQSWKIDVNSSLKSGGAFGGSPRSMLRSTLVALQAAMSILLLFGAGLFIGSLDNARAIRLGYDVDEVAYVGPLDSEPGPADRDAGVAGLVSWLAGAPGVSMVAAAASVPSIPVGVRRFFLPDESSSVGALAAYSAVSPTFFDVTGMRIVEGRGFDAGEPNAVVVDEKMARTSWPGASALGRCLVLDRPDAACTEVVGVVENQRMRVTSEPGAHFFLPLAATAGALSSASPRYVVLRFDPRRWNEVVGAAREAVFARLNERTVGIQRISDWLEPQLRPWRLGAELFTAAGILALLLTMAGVYGVMAYTVSQRRHEMGVRFALGAKLRDVATLVLREGLRVVAAGIALGIGASLVLGRLVEALLFGVTARDPASIAIAAAVLLLSAVAACLVPAWRAGLVAPGEALREE